MPVLRQSEQSIQRAVVNYAKSKGFIAIKLTSAGRFGSAGWPDYLFITPTGGAFFIEFKKEGGVPTALQVQRHRELSDHGMQASVVDAVLRGKWLIDRWVKP